MAVTRSDVARAAGVSPAVVSYVLNDGPRPVSAATRERVLSAINELQYRPNAIASALRGGSTRTIGLLTPTRSNPYIIELIEAVEAYLADKGYLVLSGSSNGHQATGVRALQAFIDRRVDGLIISAGMSLGRALERVECPVLVLEEAPEGGAQGLWVASAANEDAFDAATTVDHLQCHDHRLIGCITGPPLLRPEAQRHEGWRAQQQRAGFPDGSEMVATGEASADGGYSAALMLLSEHGRPWAVHGRRPTAVFVSSDIQAIGVLHACYELGLRVPDDVAIASVGGTRAAVHTTPPLTTMRQDVAYLAQTGCAMLLDRLHDPATPAGRLRQRGNLVVGRSCGCLDLS